MRASGRAAAPGGGLGVLALAFVLLAAPPAPGQEAPRSLAAGEVRGGPEVPSGAPPLQVFGFPVGDVRASAGGLLPLQELVEVGGETLGPAALARRAREASGGAGDGWVLGWSLPRGPGALAEQTLEVLPARLRLVLRFREGAGAEGAEGRVGGLWWVPVGAPVLMAWVRREDPEGRSVARHQYVGGWKGGGSQAGLWNVLEPERTVRRGADRELPAEAARWVASLGEGHRSSAGIEEPREGAPPPGQPLEVEVLARGQHATLQPKPARKVLRGPGEVRREWRRLHQDVRPTPPVPALPPGEELAVALYLGEVPTSGWRVEVTGAWIRDDGVVEVHTRSVEPEGMALQVLSYPYALVRLGASPEQRVVFRPEGFRR